MRDYISTILGCQASHIDFHRDAMDPQGLRERSPTPQLRMVRGNMETVSTYAQDVTEFRMRVSCVNAGLSSAP